MTAPTRDELLELYGETLNAAAPGSPWPLGQACVAVVLAAQGEADMPNVNDAESHLERWDIWALSLVGYAGRTIESVGRVNLRASIKGLAQAGQADPEPSAPAEPVPTVPDGWMRQGDGLTHPTNCESIYLVGGRLVHSAAGPTMGSDSSASIDADAARYVLGVHPSTIAADRVQDIADAHAEVEGLKRAAVKVSAGRAHWRKRFDDMESKWSGERIVSRALRVEVVDVEHKLSRSEELRAQAETQCERRTAEVETYRESDMAHRDEAARLHFAAADYREASRARIATLKAQSLADNAAVRSTYHHVVKSAGREEDPIGEGLATLQDVCKMTGVLAGEMAHERKALEVALDIERLPGPNRDEPRAAPSSTLGLGSTHPRSGVTRLHGEPEEEHQERPDKATALLLAKMLPGDSLDRLGREYGVTRQAVAIPYPVTEPWGERHPRAGEFFSEAETDDLLATRITATIEASE